MFASAKFYIVVANDSFIIKREGTDLDNIIECQSFIPNVPFYYHLFNQDKKDYIEDITKHIKMLKIKNATIIFPDESIDIEVDKRMLIEFFLQLGVKKVQESFQCFYLNLDIKKYISVSRTARVIVIQCIEHNKVMSKKYYEKGFADIDKILLDIKHLHADSEYAPIPVYINNINSGMEEFKGIGSLVHLYDLVNNVMYKH